MWTTDCPSCVDAPVDLSLPRVKILEGMFSQAAVHSGVLGFFQDQVILRYDKMLVMKGLVQRSTIKSWAEFCLQWDLNPRHQKSQSRM